MADENKRHAGRRAITAEFRGLEEDGAGELVFHSIDVSLNGAFLESDLLLEPGEKLALKLTLPGADQSIRVTARVVWVRRFPKGDERPGMGVELAQLSEADRLVLERLLSPA